LHLIFYPKYFTGEIFYCLLTFGNYSYSLQTYETEKQRAARIERLERCGNICNGCKKHGHWEGTCPDKRRPPLAASVPYNRGGSHNTMASTQRAHAGELCMEVSSAPSNQGRRYMGRASDGSNKVKHFTRYIFY
jgi:hypothetical protein